MPLGSGEITIILQRLRDGDRQAEAELFPLVYQELRRLASIYMSRERPDHTLQPTALVHEAYLRLARSETIPFESRVHFFAVAARIMRQILVDHARAFRAVKRMSGAKPLALDEALVFTEARSAELVALDEALTRLEAWSPRQSRLVELHFFGGLSFEEASTVLGVSARTLKRDWTAARAWLYGEIYGWTDQPGTLGQGE